MAAIEDKYSPSYEFHRLISLEEEEPEDAEFSMRCCYSKQSEKKKDEERKKKAEIEAYDVCTNCKHCVEDFVITTVNRKFTALIFNQASSCQENGHKHHSEEEHQDHIYTHSDILERRALLKQKQKERASELCKEKVTRKQLIHSVSIVLHDLIIKFSKHDEILEAS